MNYILHFKDESPSFSHHGVKGMKWGVRRTRTDADNAVAKKLSELGVRDTSRNIENYKRGAYDLPGSTTVKSKTSIKYEKSPIGKLESIMRRISTEPIRKIPNGVSDVEREQYILLAMNQQSIFDRLSNRPLFESTD